MQVIDLPQLQIRYDDAGIGLYGTPVAVGDSLMWFPGGSPGFAATTTRGVDVATSSFALQVQMKPGYLLEGVRLDVEGDWLAAGRATVAGLGLLRLVPLPGMTERDAGLYLFETGRHRADSWGLNTWHGSLDATLDVGASFANLTLQTTLLAAALPSKRHRHVDAEHAAFGGPFAFVDLKQASLQFVVSAVPEPDALWLMLGGLGAVAAVVRRRR